MRLKSLLTFALLVSAFILAGAQSADAAILELAVDKEKAIIGDTLIVDVRVDSEGAGINAAEATIQFPKSVLEVTSVSKGDSIFNFWLEEPSFSNDEGRVSFVGGGSSGFSGKSLQILKVLFKVRGSGIGDIAFINGAVAASDGSGTNVLTAMRGVKVAIAPSAVVSPGVAPGATPVPPPSPVPPPVQITRPAVPTGKLPIEPTVKIPLYPDKSAWYNLSSKFSAVWSLPNDVTNIATLLTNSPTSTPTASEGLFESKSFPALSDGIWYLHVRFRNNIGWGPTAHYRIGIDTAPPVPFTLNIDTEAQTDNPSPTLSYKSGDNLSGLKSYSIRVLGGESFDTVKETYKLNSLSPGRHTLAVVAVDNAGNSTEQSVDIEILPIAPPIITSVSDRVVLDEDNISIAGTSLIGGKVKLTLQSGRGVIISSKEAQVDALGNWNGEFSEPVRGGIYKILAQAIDSRGAQSLLIESSPISAVEKPLLTVAGIDITKTLFFSLLIMLILIAFGFGVMARSKISKERSQDVSIARRDITNAFGVIVKDLDKILQKYTDGKIDAREILEIRLLIERIRDKAVSASKYIAEHIEEIKR